MLPDDVPERSTREPRTCLRLARRFRTVRQRIARVNAFLAFCSALRGIDACGPPPEYLQLSTRPPRVRARSWPVVFARQALDKYTLFSGPLSGYGRPRGSSSFATLHAEPRT